MFIEFQVGNFRSFRDVQKFTMQAAPLRSNDIGLEEANVFTDSNYRLLKSKGIYGANASGKSNLATAISAFSFMVSKSVSQEDITKRLWDYRFQLISDWDNEPVFFQYSFLLHGIVYRYGFQLNEDAVLYEWLFGKDEKGEEGEYFMRTPEKLQIDDKLFLGSGIYMDLALSGDNELFRPDSLFLTAAALNGNKFATELRNEITSIITVDGVNDKAARQAAVRDLNKGTERQREALKALMRAADIGINDLQMLKVGDSFLEKKVSKEFRESIKGKEEDLRSLFSFHTKYDDDGNVVEEIAVPFGEWESQGTKKLFGIGALVLHALKSGRALLIDEFDARFHPNLTLKIVQLFHSSKSNPHNAQLIFITHDSGLLRRAELRRDQICLVNKDRFGISSIHTLIEYKGVRKDASYEKEYLSGSYEAVPYLDALDWELINKLTEDGL